MTELILAAVIFFLCGLCGWMDYNNRKERKSFLNALKAKNTEELVNLELADKTKVEVKAPEETTDLIPESDLSDDEFEEKVING